MRANLMNRFLVYGTGAVIFLLRSVFAESDPRHLLESRGQRVANFLPSAGDLTALCRAIGDEGRVYAITIPDAPTTGADGCSNVVAITLKSRNFPSTESHSDSNDPGWVYDYITTRRPIESFAAPEPLDLIWISERYSEIKTKKFGAPVMRWVNEALFDALKVGGELVVEERALDALDTRRIITAAGFDFVAEFPHGGERLLKFKRPG